MTPPAAIPDVPRLLLFINPASGSGRGADAGAETAARLRSAGAEVIVVETGWSPAGGGEHSGLAHRCLTKALQTHLDRLDPDAVVVVGGDGMVHAAVNVVARTGVPLGVVPAGTGNDFARTFGLDRLTVREAVEQIIAGMAREPLEMDLMRVDLQALPAPVTGTASENGPATETRWVAAAVNLGFDAVVNARANALTRPAGRARYVVAVLRELWGYRAPVLEVAGPSATGVDPDRDRAETFVLSVLNGRFFGGGMEAAPQARQDDGLLDVLWVPRLSPWRFLRVFPRVFAGRHTTVSEVRLRQAPEVAVRAATGGPDQATPVVHGDGEPLGVLPAWISVVPGALRLLSAGS